MKILGIETSCDETAVSLIEATGGLTDPHFSVLGNALYSQVKIHAEYGGVFPALAKREHAKNLVPLLREAFLKAKIATNIDTQILSEETIASVTKLLEREPGLAEQLIPFLQSTAKPDIDLISVTSGPGLEPALWVGINFALALGKAWNIPVMPTNHMEGHILSPLLTHHEVSFPAIALLISGGHTELVLVRDWATYEVIGETRDDAVGEAFDKVARLLSLPYPGGPEISKLAEEGRQKKITSRWTLPRPMLHSPDLDFSFSGIKTAVLYLVKKLAENHQISETFALSPEAATEIALEFENAVTEVLLAKTKKAIEDHGAETLILGGGVIANTHIRRSFQELAATHPGLKLLMPELNLSTDNAIMIAIAGYFDHLSGKQPQTSIKAEGNLQF
jgi:N6-L-threonylcarbamoyladenine synthase